VCRAGNDKPVTADGLAKGDTGWFHEAADYTDRPIGYRDSQTLASFEEAWSAYFA